MLWIHRIQRPAKIRDFFFFSHPFKKGKKKKRKKFPLFQTASISCMKTYQYLLIWSPAYMPTHSPPFSVFPPAHLQERLVSSKSNCPIERFQVRQKSILSTAPASHSLIGGHSPFCGALMLPHGELRTVGSSLGLWWQQESKQSW